MAWRRDPRELSRNVQLGLTFGVPLTVVLAMIASAAFAQMPAAPSAPAAPTGLPTGVPSAPAAPSGLPTGAPSALPTPPPAPPSVPPPTPGGGGKPPAPKAPLPPPTDSNVVLWDVEPSAGESEGPPGKVPRQLGPGVKGGISVVDSGENPLGLQADEMVVSPSSREETSRSALGWTIVLTAKDLRDRGYNDLSQILDDLPGMDVIRPYGSTYVRSYWRGERTVGADPFLLMLDGIPLNQLFNGSTQILATLPISAVDHIEIVFSPSSVIYGPNAAMGVINVITTDGKKRQEDGNYGATFGAWVTFGGPQSNFTVFGDTTKIADATASYVTRDFRIRVSAPPGVERPRHGHRRQLRLHGLVRLHEHDRLGAGTLKDYGNLAGAFHSPDRKGAVDARVYIGKGTEIGGQFLTLSTGQGTTFPGDQRQNQSLSTQQEIGVYARHVADIATGVKSTTLLQYRQSNIDATTLSSNGGAITLQSTEAHADGATVQQAFDINTRKGLIFRTDQLGFNFGLRYRHLDLPGAAQGNVVSSTTWNAGDADPLTTGKQGNAQTVSSDGFEEIGGWLQTKYAFSDAHAVNLSARVDKSSARSDVNFSFRGGYAGTFFDMLTFKVWYGHSIFEPSWEQQLTAAPAPNQTNSLGVDRMHTVEADIEFRMPVLAIHLDGYFVYTTHPLVSTTIAPAFFNVDSRELAGLDAGVRFKLRPMYVWAYYTHNFLAQDSVGNTSIATALATEGDIASDKVWVGATFEYGPFAGTLLNRWVTDRNPVPTNTTGSSTWYTLLDANLVFSNFGASGLWFGARVTNIIGTQYDQPGIQAASSGNGPALSAGPNNSRLVQPGRGIFATAGFNFDPDKPLHAGR